MPGPIKRSLSINGHQTSVTLEPVFWDRLQHEAAGQGRSLASLVAEVDTARIAAPEPPNLSSALRVWVVERLLARAGG